MIDGANFTSFFKIHSENVDRSNSQGFWKLTDEIIKSYLLEIIDKRDNVTIVDFGGGTGRWVGILDKYFQNSKFIIVDLSKDMLKKAQDKIDMGFYQNEVTLIDQNITNILELEDSSADYIISTYNPLSFVDDPQKVVNEAFRIIKCSGTVVLSTQAYYNALFSKIYNYQASPQELDSISKNKKLKWNDIVPETWQLSQQDMEGMFNRAGFVDVASRGIACLTQPQDEDWDQTNKKIGRLSKKLNMDADFFKVVLALELKSGRDQNVVNRGMNIMTIGKK